MKGFVVVGTDTNAGKTSFSLLWMSHFRDSFAYWKPVETGDSDSECVRALVPDADVYAPLARFVDAVSPPLAATRAGQSMPTIDEVISSLPASEKPILLETYGSPLSPWSASELQVELLRRLHWPVLLVSLSAVGAVGRTLQNHLTLQSHGIPVFAIALIGPRDPYAEGELTRHIRLPVFSLPLPQNRTPGEVRRLATENRIILESIRSVVTAFETSTFSDLVARDRRSVWHPYTALADVDDPLPVVGAQDEFLELADGRTVIDGISSWWTIQHGHRHPPLVQALHAAACQLDHVLFAGVTHPDAVALAELLLQSVPWQGGRVFFSDNGSTAVEVALKMAYQAWCRRGEPQRTLFVGFENGYHGDTFGAMAAGRDPVFFSRFDPLLFRTLQVPVDAEHLAKTLDEHAGQVAAVILEPLVQGAGGMRMHSPERLREIVTVTQERGVFFIADEVMTGGGRTGSLWAFEQANIQPDLICAAKTLTGGLMPLAATIASPAIVAEFHDADRKEMLFHGHSFTAHPLACAVALANWKLLASGKWKRDVTRIEQFWHSALPCLLNHSHVLDVRIQGIIAAVELGGTRGYLSEIGPRLRRMALEQGVLLRPLGNILYAMPPLCTSNQTLERIASVMKQCVASSAGW